MKRLKSYHLLFQFVALPLLLALTFYYKPKFDFSSFNISFHFSFWIVILLMPFHWVIEFFKWKVVMKRQGLCIKIAKKSFASGILSEFLIPGIPSNFLGRILFFEKEERVELSVWIQLANFTQFLVTLIFGLASMLYLNLSLSNNVIFFCCGLAFFVLLFLFLQKFNFINPLRDILNLSLFKKDSKSLYYLFFLSLLRFLFFSLQFGLLLHALSISFDFTLFAYIWTSYLVVSFSPSLFLGNILVRESITVSIFQLGHYPVFPILTATFCIWFINNLIPACIAWMYLAKKNKIK